MNSKINSIIIPVILAVALIATVGMMPTTFAQNNTDMASEGGNMTGMTQDGNMTQAQGGNMTAGMTQGQSADNGDDGDDGDDGDKDDGDSEDDKDKGE